MTRTLVLIVTLSGCTSTALRASTYSRDCKVDGDCVVVGVGDVCEPCRCERAAINASEVNRYRADRHAAEERCGQRAMAKCAPCVQVVATCAQSQCTTAPAH